HLRSDSAAADGAQGFVRYRNLELPSGEGCGRVNDVDVLAQVLTRLGVRRVFGESLPGAEALDAGVRDAAIAGLLATAGGAAGSGLGASFDGWRLSFTSDAGMVSADDDVVVASDVAGLATAVVDARSRGAGAVTVELAFDTAETRPGAVTIPELDDPTIAARL